MSGDISLEGRGDRVPAAPCARGDASAPCPSADTAVSRCRAPELLRDRREPGPRGAQHPQGEGGGRQGERRVAVQLPGGVQDERGKGTWRLSPAEPPTGRVRVFRVGIAFFSSVSYYNI